MMLWIRVLRIPLSYFTIINLLHYENVNIFNIHDTQLLSDYKAKNYENTSFRRNFSQCGHNNNIKILIFKPFPRYISVLYPRLA